MTAVFCDLTINERFAIVSEIMNNEIPYANAVMIRSGIESSGILPVRIKSPPKEIYVGVGTNAGIKKARINGIENNARSINLFL